MNKQNCQCERPVLRERAEQKGVSESFCGRCKRPIGLRLAANVTARWTTGDDLAAPWYSGCMPQ